MSGACEGTTSAIFPARNAARQASQYIMSVIWRTACVLVTRMVSNASRMTCDADASGPDNVPVAAAVSPETDHLFGPVWWPAIGECRHSLLLVYKVMPLQPQQENWSKKYRACSINSNNVRLYDSDLPLTYCNQRILPCPSLI